MAGSEPLIQEADPNIAKLKWEAWDGKKYGPIKKITQAWSKSLTIPLVIKIMYIGIPWTWIFVTLIFD